MDEFRGKDGRRVSQRKHEMSRERNGSKGLTVSNSHCVFVLES